MKRILILFMLVSNYLFSQNTSVDQDGNSFEWKTYGEQDWALVNAEVVTYRDGTPIPQVSDPTEWSNLTTGAWCYYDNDPNKGKLYNQYAILGKHDDDENTPLKKFAPQGWEVPGHNEFHLFIQTLKSMGYDCFPDGSAENYLTKALASKNFWIEENVPPWGACQPNHEPETNNSTGFNAIPVGRRYTNGDFCCGYNFNSIGELSPPGKTTFFWSSSHNSVPKGTGYSLSCCNYAFTYYDSYNQTEGFSVRFFRDDESSLPDNRDYDQDGNMFLYTTICGQDWALTNAQVETYRDGTPIQQVSDPSEWSNSITGAWTYYDNDSSLEKLYNWYSVQGQHDVYITTPDKEISPQGWRVPTKEDFDELINCLISNGYNFDGTTQNNKLAKSVSSNSGWTASWDNGNPGYNPSTNNTSGLDIFPHGWRDSNGNYNNSRLYETYFWLSTPIDNSNSYFLE